MLQMEIQAFDSLVPLAQLVRLHVANGSLELISPLTQLTRLRVANGGLNLSFDSPSHSID